MTTRQRYEVWTCAVCGLLSGYGPGRQAHRRGWVTVRGRHLCATCAREVVRAAEAEG